MSAAEYGLLNTFRSLFEGKQYLHRDSSLGDWVASYLFEDLYTLAKSKKLNQRIQAANRVLNTQNRTVGIARRRGDGTFGELVPAGTALKEDGFAVARGPIATIEVGVETKILAKAMIKQIDRVIGDLIRQTEEFKKRGGNPICVGLVGVNSSEIYTSYEGERAFLTDGKKYKHPSQEASDAITRLEQRARPKFDEFLILRFSGTNTSPYPFSWADDQRTTMEYSALLTRISREYDRRFP
ncbi:MAG TPA: hypothetical protein VMI10_26015 [Terriglobales bacterium]|nr:hypothetical protein [Terriglobales bacterium]